MINLSTGDKLYHILMHNDENIFFFPFFKLDFETSSLTNLRSKQATDIY